MTNLACAMPGCTSGQAVLIKSRGACSPCYQRLRKADGFAPTRDVSMYHRLTEIVPESKTAHCSICGPTAIVGGGERKTRLGTEYRWRCYTRQESNRSWYLKRDYGLTAEQYRAMVEAQGGCCAICRKPEDAGRGLAVDHCHETGRPRGLLCWQCNTAIGKLGDTVEGVRAALRYLEAAR